MCGRAPDQANSDILAVGHGQHRWAPPQRGLLCLWSLRDTGCPLWALPVGSGVTALAWSGRTGLLAVGLQDGCLAVYDVKARQVHTFVASRPPFPLLLPMYMRPALSRKWSALLAYRACVE